MPGVTSVNKRNDLSRYRTTRTQHDISKDLVIRHLDMANSDTKAQHFLELELDRRAHLRELVVQILCG